MFCALVNGEGEVTDFLRLPHFTKRRNAWREEEREKKVSYCWDECLHVGFGTMQSTVGWRGIVNLKTAQALPLLHANILPFPHPVIFLAEELFPVIFQFISSAPLMGSGTWAGFLQAGLWRRCLAMFVIKVALGEDLPCEIGSQDWFSTETLQLYCSDLSHFPCQAQDIETLKKFLLNKKPHVVTIAGENRLVFVFLPLPSLLAVLPSCLSTFHLFLSAGLSPKVIPGPSFALSPQSPWLSLPRDAQMLMEDVKRIVHELDQGQQLSSIGVELVDNELAILYMNSKKSEVNLLLFQLALTLLFIRAVSSSVVLALPCIILYPM